VIKQTTLAPVFGAVVLAYKAAFNKVDENFVNALQKAQKRLFGR